MTESPVQRTWSPATPGVDAASSSARARSQSTASCAAGATLAASRGATTSCVVPSALARRRAISACEPGPITRRMVAGRSPRWNRPSSAAANSRSAATRPPGRCRAATAVDSYAWSGQQRRTSSAARRLSASEPSSFDCPSAASLVRSGAPTPTPTARASQAAAVHAGRRLEKVLIDSNRRIAAGLLGPTHSVFDRPDPSVENHMPDAAGHPCRRLVVSEDPGVGIGADGLDSFFFTSLL